MKKIFTFYIIIFILIGCEEYYTPDIDKQQSNYVFNGVITNQSGPQKVRITKSLDFNSLNSFECVLDARVFIEEKNGRTINLSLRIDSIGYYVTDSSVVGIVNNEYRLHVIMADDKEYYSSYEKLLAAAPIDTLSAEYYQTIISSKESDGYSTQTIDGIRILNNTESEQYTPYYRYFCNMVFQTVQIFKTSPLTTSRYIFRPVTSYGNLYIANGNEYTNHNITNNPLYLARRSMIELEFPDIIEGVEYDIVNCGVMVKAMQYSLSENAYNYWKTIADQQKASNYLFDPIEAQVKGNLRCQSDTTELVFGYFGASAITEKLRAFGLDNKNDIISRPVRYFPILDSTIIDSIEPHFFINFL